MALYLDTSCLLKVFFPQAETDRTLALIAAEARAVVSSLAKLEMRSQINARVAGGMLSPARARRLWQRVEAVTAAPPYEHVACPADIIDIAAEQITFGSRRAHCRTLDRLHLATMLSLGIRRLLTNDERQAAVARGMGLDVTLPR